MDGVIVGRDAEREALARLVGSAERTRALLLEGEAGIGKSSLWDHGVGLAREGGLAVLAARPAEAEAALPYVAVVDLVDGALADAPAPLDDVVAGRPADEVLVARAVLAVIRKAAEEAPVLLAVDDVQWLDGPSANVLAFVVRRLADLPVRLLLARRSDGAMPPPLGIDRAFRDQLSVRRVPPLTTTELDRVIAARLGVHLVRPKLERLQRACSGNPLYALELAPALAAAGDDEPLVLPAHLADALGQRVRALPEPARAAALLAAASLQPTVQLVERAAGGSAGLAAAVGAGVLVVDGRRLRFAHPLLAEATYAAAPPWERRDAHALLAEYADARLERAHHLARSVDDPDDEVATELEAAADEAASLGVPAPAAELAAAAARLTSDPGLRNGRAIKAAELRIVSGDPEGARAELERLVDELPAGATRARVLALIADVILTMDPARGLALQYQALEEARDDPALAAEIELGLATTTWNTGDIHASTEHMRAAVALAEQAESGEMLAMCLGELLHCEMMLGRPFDAATAERALALEDTLDLPPGSYFRPSISLAVVYVATDRLDEARALLEREVERIQGIGDEGIRWGVLARFADLELRVGRLDAAVERAREALEAARLLDHAGIERFALLPYAASLARVGDVAEARVAARDALAQSDGAGSRLTALRARGILGFCDVSEGRPEDAWTTLEPAVVELQALGIGEVSMFGVAPDAIEALVALGRPAEAREIVEWVERCGAPASRTWHRAVAARGRALAAAAEGDLDEARAAAGAALAASAVLAQPFEHARTLFVQGQIARRAKQRAESRTALTAALDLFDGLGCALWSERTAAELARIPGRAPRSDALSETEQRIAQLVATGLSNKEVAASLFVTVRTVEANLSKVYAKLGVRSRSELASRLNG